MLIRKWQRNLLAKTALFLGLTVVLYIVQLDVWWQRAHIPEREIDEMLGWVHDANAKTMFDADVREGKWRFLRVCGDDCWLPPFGTTTVQNCYPGTRLEYLVLEHAATPHHQVLNQRAVEFATEYNRLVAAAKNEQGTGLCRAFER